MLSESTECRRTPPAPETETYYCRYHFRIASTPHWFTLLSSVEKREGNDDIISAFPFPVHTYARLNTSGTHRTLFEGGKEGNGDTSRAQP